MRISTRRLSLWVLISAIAFYIVVETSRATYRSRSTWVDYLVAGLVFAIIVGPANRRPLGYFVLGVVLLNCLPFIPGGPSLYLSVWGAYLACFIGALSGWDGMRRDPEKAIKGRPRQKMTAVRTDAIRRA